MQDKQRIAVDIQDNCLVTKGAKAMGYAEFQITIPNPDLEEPGRHFLQYLCHYLESYRPDIEIGETFAYGCWLTRFNEMRDGYIQIGEYLPAEDKYSGSLFYALEVWEGQQQTCQEAGTDFLPPKPDQMVVISDGVYEGVVPLEGIRYTSPEHMSGWWLTTDEYDKNEKTWPVHLQHILAQRTEIVHLLALPYGYSFRSGEGEKDIVWFDEQEQSIEE